MQFSPSLSRREAPDGGWGWVIVFGSFMVSFIGDGFCYTTGIFYEKFIKIYGESEAVTSLFESVLTAMIYCSGPFASALVNAYGSKNIAIIGSVMASTGMLASVLLDSIYMHIITLGLITGTGLGLLFLPQIMIVNYWFNKRLAFAIGIALCGSGLGMATFAVMIESLIKKFGWKGCMIMLSGIMFTCVAFSALFREVNVSVVEVSVSKSSLKSVLKETFNFKILANIVFLYYAFANFLNGSVYYVPIIFLKAHIKTTGIGDDSDAITLMVVFGLSNSCGRAVFGYIADNESFNRIVLYSMSIIIYGVAIGWIAYFGHNFTLLVISIVIFGVSEGAFVCLSCVVVVDLFGVERASNAFGILSFISGIASFLGPPIIGKTVKITNGYTTGYYICSVITIISGILLLFLPIINRKYNRYSK